MSVGASVVRWFYIYTFAWWRTLLGAHVYVSRCLGVHLVPNLEEAVPAARADRHAVLCDAEAGHTVIVTREHTCN